jgi:hypothetical protein
MYQINQYGLLLVNIIGTSSLHKTTQIGLAFLSGEAELRLESGVCVYYEGYLKSTKFDSHKSLLPTANWP